MKKQKCFWNIYRRNYLKRFDKRPQKCSYSLSPTQELYQSHYSEQAEKINADNSLSRLSKKESFTVFIKADSTMTLMLENVAESKNYRGLLTCEIKLLALFDYAVSFFQLLIKFDYAVSLQFFHVCTVY